MIKIQIQPKEYIVATLIIGIFDSWITQPLKIILVILKDLIIIFTNKYLTSNVFQINVFPKFN